MLYKSTLFEISNNINTGVEYEIALFYQLLKGKPAEQTQVMAEINKRIDSAKVKNIISQTDISTIVNCLKRKGYTLQDVTFETQNDEVGPADIVMHVKSDNGQTSQIGLSVKYANTCTLNVSGRYFITDAQIAGLKSLLPEYTRLYVEEMRSTYGNVANWFRKRKPSRATDAYIDLVRDAVISNWNHVGRKANLLSALFHSDSPIEFWVITYSQWGYTLKTVPETIDSRRANDVIVKKHQTSFIAFWLDGRMVGQMQVKFNNGFVEKCTKKNPDIVVEGVPMQYGKPFGSWNFSVMR